MRWGIHVEFLELNSTITFTFTAHCLAHGGFICIQSPKVDIFCRGATTIKFNTKLIIKMAANELHYGHT